MTLPPTIRQLVDRLAVLEEQRDPRTVVIVATSVDAEGVDADFVIVDGVPEADPDYKGPDRYIAVLGPRDEPVVDPSDVVQESLNRPRGIRHSLDTRVRWIPRW